MKGGTQVVIRAISPDDEPLMVRFHSVLSDRTVYLRYFCSLSLTARTAHERLVRICFADPERETVLVAIQRDEASGEQSIVAVGRLNKLLPKNEAEVSSLVSDEYQGRGLGNRVAAPTHSSCARAEAEPDRRRDAARQHHHASRSQDMRLSSTPVR